MPTRKLNTKRLAARITDAIDGLAYDGDVEAMVRYELRLAGHGALAVQGGPDVIEIWGAEHTGGAPLITVDVKARRAS